MALVTPLWMQAAEGDTAIDFSALNDRLLIGELVSEGVFGTGALAVSQRAAGANMSVDVARGAAVIDGDDVDDQGAYLVASTAVENLVIPAPPGAGSRTHRIVAQIKDKLHNSTDWSSYEWSLMVLEDTGSGTPALPDSAITLALVTVDSTMTAVEDEDIDDQRTQAAFGGSAGKASSLMDADDAAIASNVTLANTGLAVTVAAGRKYEIRATIIFSAGAGDIKLDVTGPTGCGCDLTAFGLGTTAVALEGDLKAQLLLASPTITAFGGAGVGTKVTAYLHGHLYSGVGGTVRIRAAQLASSAEATQLYAQSLLIADPFE
jgi:hypothetical protein